MNPTERTSATTVNTHDEEDAGRWLTPTMATGAYCPEPCLGVSVIHPAHL